MIFGKLEEKQEKINKTFWFGLELCMTAVKMQQSRQRTPETRPMATATKTTGFQVCCPYCNDEDATINVNLADVHALTCTGCDQEFSPEQARAKAAEALARWDAVCCWVEMAAELAAE